MQASWGSGLCSDPKPLNPKPDVATLCLEAFGRHGLRKASRGGD